MLNLLLPAGKRLISISDLHLGGGCTRTDELLDFLGGLSLTDHDDIDLWAILFNGDSADGAAGMIYSDAEVAVIHRIDSIRQAGVLILACPGNHDPTVPAWLTATHVAEEDGFAVESEGQRFWFLHGHRWDQSLALSPTLTEKMIEWERDVASWDVDLARKIKEEFNLHGGVVESVEAGVRAALAANPTLAGIVRGHTHEDAVRGRSFDTGSWCGTRKPCWLELVAGTASLNTFGG